MPQTEFKCDRRSLRSQHALLAALARQLAEGGDLSRITVAQLTESAGLTRRTFYTHYRDIPDFVEHVEEELLAQIGARISRIAASTLPELAQGADQVEGLGRDAAVLVEQRPVHIGCDEFDHEVRVPLPVVGGAPAPPASSHTPGAGRSCTARAEGGGSLPTPDIRR